MDPTLLAGVLATELAFDYDGVDHWIDGTFGQPYGILSPYSAFSHGVAGQISGDVLNWIGKEIFHGGLGATGPGNTHIEPALIPAYEYLSQFYSETNHPWHQHPDTPDLNDPYYVAISHYMLTDIGGISATAMVVRHLQDQYGVNVNLILTTEDRAVIYGAFRNGIGTYGSIDDYSEWLRDNDVGPSRQLSIPWMEYMEEIFGYD